MEKTHRGRKTEKRDSLECVFMSEAIQLFFFYIGKLKTTAASINRERERDRERDRETNRQTDKQTDRKTWGKRVENSEAQSGQGNSRLPRAHCNVGCTLLGDRNPAHLSTFPN